MKITTNNSFRVLVLVLFLMLIGFGSLHAQFSMGNTLAPLAGNPYPIVYSNDVMGGYHQVATIAARNAIPALRRQSGMLCTVLDAGSGTPKTYQLLGGILDVNWVEFTSGSAATVTTNANLTGEVTSVGNATTLTNAAVIGKVLTGYVSGAGTVAATDNILQAIQKLNGNVVTGANLVWNLTGNGGTTPGTNFIGTTDDKDVIFKRNGVQSGLLNVALANTSFGVSALNPATTGGNNSALGYQTLMNNTTGANNAAIGGNALNANTTGINNLASGFKALQNNTTGVSNVANGYAALFGNITGTSNVAIGSSTLFSNVAGSYGVAIGINSQYYANNTTTPYANTNTSVGTYSLQGSSVAANNTGNSNTALGYNTLNANTTGNSNSAIGVNALQNNTTGGNNTANGYTALFTNTTGSNNVASGYAALYNNTTGIGNTALGFQAGYTDGTTTTPATLTNATTIGYYAQVTASNSVVLGGTGTYAANVGIGTTAPAYKLEVAGDVAAKRYLTTMPAAIAAAATTTVDLSSGNVYTLNVAASITTLTLTNAPTRPATFVFKLSYSSGTAYTITWPAAFLWSGGIAPILTCISGKTDILSIIFDGTNYYCSYALNF